MFSLEEKLKTHNFILGPVDTDSVSFCKQDGSSFTKEEQDSLLEEINSHCPELIQYDHDGYFPVCVALKSKNYILLDEEGNLTIKGSALKSSKLEKALKKFISEIINCLVYDKQSEIVRIYEKYIKECYTLKDIGSWTSKKTLTAKVLTPERTTEQKILDALNGRHAQMGDKIYVYFREDGSLAMQEDWNNDHDPIQLSKRVYSTLSIFKNVIDMDQFEKYHLKGKKEQLYNLLGVPYEKPAKKSKKAKVSADGV